MTKQTGPEWAVKRFGRLAVLAAAIILPGCSSTGGWTHPDKSPAEVRADMDACDKIGEEDTLLREGRARADSGPPGGPTAGNLGPSPMQMHDQSEATRDFHRSYDSCMESKGYTHGKSATN
ncbi:MAG: hypothetical protein EPO08_13250 [Rhodospirillaceae bacterium]|nr:MAG: hypothetical protein EPO08_13250 [Rhodospirillaceae bacterium]